MPCTFFKIESLIIDCLRRGGQSRTLGAVLHVSAANGGLLLTRGPLLGFSFGSQGKQV